MHLYKVFFTRCCIALAAIVMGSPKMAWNEQVCAHQKSLGLLCT